MIIKFTLAFCNQYHHFSEFISYNASNTTFHQYKKLTAVGYFTKFSAQQFSFPQKLKWQFKEEQKYQL